MKYNIKFNGSKMGFTGYTLLWSLGIAVSFGILFPAYIVWSFKWFAENTEIIKG